MVNFNCIAGWCRGSLGLKLKSSKFYTVTGPYNNLIIVEDTTFPANNQGLWLKVVNRLKLKLRTTWSRDIILIQGIKIVRQVMMEDNDYLFLNCDFFLVVDYGR